MDRKLVVWTFISVPFLIGSSEIAAQRTPHAVVHAQNLKVIAVPAQAPRALIGPEAESFDVTFDTVFVEAGQTVKSFLEARHLAPGGSVYGLMYAANPELDDVNHLAEGQMLVLPRLESVDIQGDIPEGYVWKMDAFSEFDARVTRAFSALQKSIEAFRPDVILTLPADVDRDRLERTIQRISGAVDMTRLANSPAGPATLSLIYFYSMRAEELINEIGQERDDFLSFTQSSLDSRGELSGGPAPDGGLPWTRARLQAQVAELDQLADELSAVGECVGQNLRCDVSTEVDTRSRGGDERQELELFAAPYILAELEMCRSDPICTRPFDRRSTPTTILLAAGTTWTAWAVDATGKRVGTRDLSPRRGEENRFDLTVEAANVDEGAVDGGSRNGDLHAGDVRGGAPGG